MKMKSRSIISLIIIICLSVSSFICSKGILEEAISRQVDSWPLGQPEIFTSRLTVDQYREFVSTLRDFSKDHRFILISQSRMRHESESDLYVFSVFTSPDIDQISLDPLVVLGTPIVDKALIQKVATADINEYAGCGINATKCIARMPSIRSGAYFHVNKLSIGNNFERSCKVVGLKQKEFNELIDVISSSTGASKEDLTTKTSGLVSGLSPIYLFSGGAFVILSVVFCLFTVTCTLLELKTLGVYMMLGWSKRDFVRKLFSSQTMQLLAVIPVCALGTYLVLDGFTFDVNIFGYVCATMIPPICVVLISLGIAALSLAFIKPVDAILSRYSRCGFYILTIVTYLICLFAVFVGCQHIEQPFKTYLDAIRTRTSWDQYSDWYVVEDYRVGDAKCTRSDKNFLEENMYAWYAAHEHDEGVFLANTCHYNDDVIQACLPEGPHPKPFWYLAASPSYLRHVGVDVSDADVAKAEGGVRVHLLPKSFSASQADGVKELLRKHSKCWESNITTTFMKNPRFEFSSYDGNQQLFTFTWHMGVQQSTTADNFVIAVITANNMIPFESESLVAQGPENSYIKLIKKGASTCLDDRGMASLNESPYKARFVTVANYIDDIQRILEHMFVLFSIALIVMAATLVVILVCFINIVNKMRAREIGVKYVLGFSAWDMYGKEILFVNLATLGGIIISGILGYVVATLAGGALLVISNFVIGYVVRKNSVGAILEIVSKEQ